MDLEVNILIFFVGLFSATYGIIVGAGGGFIFVPALLIILQLPPHVAAGTGLVIVLINALSGVYSYSKQKRIDYKLGMRLSFGAIPGTLVGVWLTQLVSSESFNIIFGSMLLALAIFLFIKRDPTEREKQEEETKTDPYTYMDAKKHSKPLENVFFLFCVGFLLGIVSSFFGIGGGWLLVPILIYIFRISPHIATATSIFSLCLYSIIGAMIYGTKGSVDWMVVLWGGAGVLFGSQLGAYLSAKISGKLIIRLLSLILVIVGGKLLLT